MILLALDASTTAVGWCLADRGSYLESGVFVPKGKDWVDRILAIEEWLINSPSQWRYGSRPDIIALEIATGDRGNMATHRKLGAVEYAIKAAARIEYDINVTDVTASQVKASGCHKGMLLVAEAIIHERFPDRTLTPGHEGDEADAIGCYLAGWKQYQQIRLCSEE